jgi:hypothetical protein
MGRPKLFILADGSDRLREVSNALPDLFAAGIIAAFHARGVARHVIFVLAVYLLDTTPLTIAEIAEITARSVPSVRGAMEYLRDVELLIWSEDARGLKYHFADVASASVTHHILDNIRKNHSRR